MMNYCTYRITCIIAWLPAAVSARSLRCFAIRSLGTAAGRLRGVDVDGGSKYRIPKI